MLEASFFLGEALDFKGICSIYPPKVKDIAKNDDGLRYCRVLTYSPDDIEDVYSKQLKENPDYVLPTPFQFVFINSLGSQSFRELVEQAFLFFTHTKPHFLTEQKVILLCNDEDISKITDVSKAPILNADNFMDFQNYIRGSMGLSPYIPPPVDEDPDVARIKALGRRRERIARRKRAKGNSISLTTYLASICCMGIGLTPLNIGEISYASVNLLIKIYQGKEKYDIDIRSLIGGADPKKIKPKYWINEDDSEFKEITI